MPENPIKKKSTGMRLLDRPQDFTQGKGGQMIKKTTALEPKKRATGMEILDSPEKFIKGKDGQMIKRVMEPEPKLKLSYDEKIRLNRESVGAKGEPLADPYEEKKQIQEMLDYKPLSNPKGKLAEAKNREYKYKVAKANKVVEDSVKSKEHLLRATPIEDAEIAAHQRSRLTKL